MFIGRILSGNWEDGTLTVRDMPNEFVLSARKVRISELDETLQVEALCKKLAKALAKTNQYLRIRTRPLKPYTQERRVDILMAENAAVLAEATELEEKHE